MKKEQTKLEYQREREARAKQLMQAQVDQCKNYQRKKVIEDQGIEYQDQASFQENKNIIKSRKRYYEGPIDVLEDPKLSSDAKVLFHIISNLSFNEGFCYASNPCLGEKMGKGARVIQNYLNELENYGLIKRDTYETKLGKRRNIYIQCQYFRDLYFTKSKESKTKARWPRKAEKRNQMLVTDENGKISLAK